MTALLPLLVGLESEPITTFPKMLLESTVVPGFVGPEAAPVLEKIACEGLNTGASTLNVAEENLNPESFEAFGVGRFRPLTFSCLQSPPHALERGLLWCVLCCKRRSESGSVGVKV